MNTSYTDTIELTPENLTAIETAFQSLETEMSNLKGLNRKQVRQMPTTDRQRLEFVQTAIQTGLMRQGLLPRDLDPQKLQNLLQMRTQLNDFEVRLGLLKELVEDSAHAVGADLYSGARAIYRSLKHNTGEAGVDDQVSELRNQSACPS